MSLYKDKQIKELYDIRHRNDNRPYNAIDMDNNILKKSLPPFIYSNDTMNNFLTKLEKLVALILDHVHILRNFKNYMVDKDYNEHIN